MGRSRSRNREGDGEGLIYTICLGAFDWMAYNGIILLITLGSKYINTINPVLEIERPYKPNPESKSSRYLNLTICQTIPSLLLIHFINQFIENPLLIIIKTILLIINKRESQLKKKSEWKIYLITDLTVLCLRKCHKMCYVVLFLERREVEREKGRK